MFNARSKVPNVFLRTERLVVRLANQHDAYRLAQYYTINKDYLLPWEPIRDNSYCQSSGWQARLNLINELHKHGSAYYFVLLEPEQREIIGIANFSNVIRGEYYGCVLGYSVGQAYQGKGLMFEALHTALHHMFTQQHMHRVSAFYMPHNHRSGNLLARLGFEKEGYAKNYMRINGEWHDHVLMALVNDDWAPM